MDSTSMRQKIEEAVREFIELQENINKISKTLEEVHQTENPNELDQSMKNYRKSKENLLKSAKVKLFDQKLQKIWKEYEAIRELKKKEQLEILDKILKVKEESDLMIDTFIANTKEFVQKQEEVLRNFDLKPLEEVAKLEKRFCANASEKIKKDTCLFNKLQETIKDHDVKIKISTELEDDKIESAPIKQSSVVFYNFVDAQPNDDSSLVRQFLAGLNFEEPHILFVERIGQRITSNNRLLKVTFGNEEIVEKLLKLPIGRTKFKGHFIRIAKTQR